MKEPKRVKTGHKSHKIIAHATKQKKRMVNHPSSNESRDIARESRLDISRVPATLSLRPSLSNISPTRPKRKPSISEHWKAFIVQSCRTSVNYDFSITESQCSFDQNPESPAGTASRPLEPRGNAIMTTQPFVQYDLLRSKKVIEAYHIATQILEDVAGKTSTAYITPYGDTQDNYVTPYGPPQTVLESSNEDKKAKFGNALRTRQATPKSIAHNASIDKNNEADKAARESFSSHSIRDPEVDHAQVDRLLFLAGGDSFTDNDDTDDDVEVVASFIKAQPDADVEAIVKHVLQTVVSRDGIGTKQAMNLQSIIDQGTIVKNLIIPRSQGQATSRFYATLASRAQGSSRPGGGALLSQGYGINSINTPEFYSQTPGPITLDCSPTFSEAFPSPNHSNANGQMPKSIQAFQSGTFVPDTMAVNQQGKLVPHRLNRYGRLVPINNTALPKPQPLNPQRPFLPSNTPPPPIPSRVGTARGKTVEEAKKVRDYGFPPLPSSRPGKRADTNPPSKE